MTLLEQAMQAERPPVPPAADDELARQRAELAVGFFRHEVTAKQVRAVLGESSLRTHAVMAGWLLSGVRHGYISVAVAKPPGRA